MIELVNINKVYRKGNKNDVHALKDVFLNRRRGTGCTGGCFRFWKSTLLHILGCLDDFDSGEYCFKGRNITKLGAKQIARIRNEEIGFVLQSFGLIRQYGIQQYCSSSASVKQNENFRD